MKMKSLLLTALATIGLIAATMAQVPNYVPTNGLVGWWPFNGNANDQSGNGNNGVVNGATLTTDRFGTTNSSYYFDGVSNVITIPSFSPGVIQNQYSMSIWINNADNLDHQSIYLRQGANFSKTWILKMDNSNELRVYNENSFYSTYNHPVSLLNAWYHLCITINSNIIKFYINGVNVHTETINYPLTWTNDPQYLGFSGNTGNQPYPFLGKLDDIGMWNTVLSQQNIIDFYNASLCANNTNITPQNFFVSTGGTTIFTSSTADPNPAYVWQSDFGQGFQTLTNFGNYSGANSNTLAISNIQLQNHTQPIRVISTSGNCVDTSNVVIITVTDTCINTLNDTNLITVTDTLIINTSLGINPPNNVNTIKVFPNPASTHITIDYGNFAIMNGYQLIIENSTGQQVFQTNINQQSDYLSLATWSGNGLYFVHIIDPQGNTLDIRKIVLQ